MKAKLFRIVNKYIAESPNCIREYIYKTNGLLLGKDSLILKSCRIDNPGLISIGKNSLVNRYCEFHTDDDLRATISIGDNTRIGFGVKFICVTHDTGDHNRRAGKLTYKPIKVGDGCWIG